ncbi:N-formylglutamate deformylase [Cedecea neteri]|uniref:N-formylglutamate deformylase n=1 Tax=Cedecea neteri TaxID=158822 RepID=A0A2X3L208_9ENTR|nr:N-formylglutamate deformylase [Cedecea neteri]
MIKGFELHQGKLPLLISMPHPGTQLTPEVANGLTARAKKTGRYRLAYSQTLPADTRSGRQHAQRQLFPLTWLI